MPVNPSLYSLGGVAAADAVLSSFTATKSCCRCRHHSALLSLSPPPVLLSLSPPSFLLSLSLPLAHTKAYTLDSVLQNSQPQPKTYTEIRACATSPGYVQGKGRCPKAPKQPHISGVWKVTHMCRMCAPRPRRCGASSRVFGHSHASVMVL